MNVEKEVLKFLRSIKKHSFFDHWMTNLAKKLGEAVQQSQFNVNVLSKRVQWVDSDSKNIGSIIKHQHLLFIEKWKSQVISSFFLKKYY